MEALVGKLDWNERRQTGDDKMRMSIRPPMARTESSNFNKAGAGSQRRTGRAVEDLGSSFAKSPTKPKARAAPMSKRQPKLESSVLIDLSDSGSDDRLDLLSHHSNDDESFYREKKKKDEGKGKGKSTGKGATDKSLDAYQHKVASSSNALKGLKFKKTKLPGDGTIVSDAPASQDPVSKVPENIRTYNNGPPSTTSTANSTMASQSSLRHPRSPPIRKIPQPKRSSSPERRVVLPRKAAKISREDSIVQNSRPRPRPLGGRTASAQHPSQMSSGGGSQSVPTGSPARRNTISEARPFPLSHSSSTAENDNPVKGTLPRTKAISKPASIAPLSRIQSPMRAADFPSLTPLASQETPIARKPLPKKKDAKSKSTNAFPALSPLSSQSGNGKEKGMTSVRPSRKSTLRIMSSDEESEDEDLKAQPFPMSTQVLNSIGTPSIAGPSSLGKRPSPGNDTWHENKKRKDGDAAPMVLEDYEFEEEDTITISPSTDPRTLCPYCDSPLPSSPTPLLNRLLASTFEKSYRQARPANPLGRKAPFAVFIAVCQRHRFESQILPEAELKGWPKSIDWAELGKRVERMKRTLHALIIDSQVDEDYGVILEDTPRMKCVFWKEVMGEVKQKGARAVAGVRGQFASFEKTQPGYYGELGSVIIHQTLYNLFPPTSINPDSVAPLTASEFVQRILVPEVGVRLIIEDQELDDDGDGMEKAVRILRESASYGVSMFPADDGEEDGEGGRGAVGDDDVGVADLIVMERARKRRKELEADEVQENEQMQVEEERQMQEEMTRKAATRKKPAEKSKKGRAKAPEPPTSAPSTRPKPRPVGKSSSTASVLQDGVDIPDEDLDQWVSAGDTDVEVPTSPIRNYSSQLCDDDITPQRFPIPRTPSGIDIDLCSSADEEPTRSEGGRHPRKAKTKAKKHVESEEDPEFLRPPSSKMFSVAWSPEHFGSDDVIEEAPMDSDGWSSSKPSSLTATSSKDMFPLKLAQERKSKIANVSFTAPSAYRDKTHSWILSDSSQSSMESGTNK